MKQFDYLSILGPTGSGKTALAIALAKVFPIEVISVDSVSVYQRLDIGSAKPTREEMDGVVHHLINCETLDHIYTVGRFVEDANHLVGDIKSRGKIPLFCGGTMMYMRAFQNGYAGLPVISGDVLSEVDDIYNHGGVGAIYEMLKQKDPVMASKISSRDQQRIHRSLAVILETGKSLSDYWQQGTCQYKGHDILLMVENRAAHREKLAGRIDKMLALGLQQECEGVLADYGIKIQSHPAMKSIGYKEMVSCVCGTMAITDVRDKSIISSAQYVKRQMTWLNTWQNPRSTKIALEYDKQCINQLVISLVESLSQ